MQEGWQIRQLTKKDDQLHTHFLNEISAESTCVLGYHFPFYKNILEECGIGQAYYLGLFSATELIAILPGVIKDTEIGTVYSSLPFFGPNAGVIVADKNNSAEVHHVLINAAINYLKSFKKPLSASLYTPFLASNFEYYEQALENAVSVSKSTQYLSVAETEWDSKIRYDLRKVERSGLSISEEISPDKVDALYTIYSQNCIDYNIPKKPREVIDALAQAAQEGENVNFYFTFFEGKIIGGLIVIYSKTTLSYYLPCSLDAHRSLQAVTYMIDYAFQKAKSAGIRYWNWESSPDTESGVYKFKKKWGSLSSEYRVYIKCLCDIAEIKALGKEKIMQQFPYFFVLPFNLM